MSLNFGNVFDDSGCLDVVGSAMGLICCYAFQDGYLSSKFIVFNPETRSFLSVETPLPSMNSSYIPSPPLKGFGFDDTTLDYKIFLAASNLYVYIYSFNTKSWRFIPCQFSWDVFFRHTAVFAKACFHWLADDDYCEGGPSILVFDIKSETFRWILLQDRFSGTLSIIEGFGESSIGIVEKIYRHRSTLTHAHVWLMDQNTPTHVWLMDQNGSWFKAADDVLVVNRSEGKQVLGFRNKDELIINVYSPRLGVVSQNIKTRVVRDVMSEEVLHDMLSTEARGHFDRRVHTHVPCLVLLDKTIAQSI